MPTVWFAAKSKVIEVLSVTKSVARRSGVAVIVVVGGPTTSNTTVSGVGSTFRPSLGSTAATESVYEPAARSTS